MSSKYFKSERVLLDGRFKPATLAVEEGTIRQILDYSFPNSDDGHVVDFGEKIVLPGLVDTHCLLYTSPSPRDRTRSRMPSSA